MTQHPTKPPIIQILMRFGRNSDRVTETIYGYQTIMFRTDTNRKIEPGYYHFKKTDLLNFLIAITFNAKTETQCLKITQKYLNALKN
jgi:hypothetical protein